MGARMLYRGRGQRVAEVRIFSVSTRLVASWLAAVVITPVDHTGARTQTSPSLVRCNREQRHGLEHRGRYYSLNGEATRSGSETHDTVSLGGSSP